MGRVVPTGPIRPTAPGLDDRYNMVMAEAHDPYAALRSRDYRRLLTANLLASLGAEMQAVAIGWEIWEQTRAYWCLGLVGLVQFVPVLFLALPAGQAADRFNRKYLLSGALVAMTAAALGLALLAAARASEAEVGGAGSANAGWSAIELLTGPLLVQYLLLAAAGAARAFSIPARWSLLPQVVPADVLRNAVAWNSSGWQVATISGPALGGLAIAGLGAAGAYLATAACESISMVLVLSLRVSPPVSAGSVDAADGHRLAAWWAGAAFIWRTKPILAALTLDLFAVLLGGATALLPVFAKDILAVGPVGLGWLRAAPSVGALAMAVALAHRPPLRRPGAALLAAVAGFGAAIIVFGLSTHYCLSWLALALTGAFDNVSVVVRGTMIQTLTPDALRGRVAAVNAVFISSSNELGALESGYAAQWFGPVWGVVLGGIGTLLVVAVVARTWPQLWRLSMSMGTTSP